MNEYSTAIADFGVTFVHVNDLANAGWPVLLTPGATRPSLMVAGRRAHARRRRALTCRAGLKTGLESKSTRIGMVFQFGELLPELTARQNVALPSRLMGMRRDEAEGLATSWLVRFGLSNQMDSHPDSMSGGEQQRVGLARALAHRPALLLADEPTGMLDERNTRQVIELMMEAGRELGTAVVVATHDSTVAAAANRVLRLHDSSLVPANPAVSSQSMSP